MSTAASSFISPTTFGILHKSPSIISRFKGRVNRTLGFVYQEFGDSEESYRYIYISDVIVLLGIRNLAAQFICWSKLQ